MALIPVEDALTSVLHEISPLPSEMVALDAAYRRVLAADLAARRSVPSSDVSAMDGYAVRGADVADAPARLKVMGEVAAGHPNTHVVQGGEALRIFTGGVMPQGADTVVIQENTIRRDDWVIVNEAARKGQNVRRAGHDFHEGDFLLRKGRRLSARDLALAATMNHAEMPVHRRPLIALFATGDELVKPGSALKPGAVIHSNAYALAAMIQAEGGQVQDCGIVSDTLEATRQAIRNADATGADVLVTTGGASVGDHDWVGRALEAEGFQMSFWKVAMRPGKPVMFGRRGALRVIGLPGNPVSSFVGATLFLMPLVRALAGRTDIRPTSETAILAADLPANGEREDYMRATLATDAAGRIIATPQSRQDSAMLSPLSQADCMIVRPSNVPAAKAGSPCVILKLAF